MHAAPDGSDAGLTERIGCDRLRGPCRLFSSVARTRRSDPVNGPALIGIAGHRLEACSSQRTEPPAPGPAEERGAQPSDYDHTMAGDKYTERLAEESAALFTLLIAVEALLFNADRVRDDGADVVTLAAFGGLAAAVLRDRLPWGGREAASATLGFIAGLAVFHGTKNDVEASGLAGIALSVSQWN